jgi:Flp pilus assembly protein TadG
MTQRQPAVSTVSFVLIAPIFLLVVFGLFECARVLNAWLVITNEATEAARYGAIHHDPAADPALETATVQAYIRWRLDGVLAPSGLSPAPVVLLTSDPAVDVTINYKVPLVIPLVSNVLPNPFPVGAHAAMHVELEE